VPTLCSSIFRAPCLWIFLRASKPEFFQHLLASRWKVLTCLIEVIVFVSVRNSRSRFHRHDHDVLPYQNLSGNLLSFYSTTFSRTRGNDARSGNCL
jgi:hypothetical protein